MTSMIFSPNFGCKLRTTCSSSRSPEKPLAQVREYSFFCKTDNELLELAFNEVECTNLHEHGSLRLYHGKSTLKPLQQNNVSRFIWSRKGISFALKNDCWADLAKRHSRLRIGTPYLTPMWVSQILNIGQPRLIYSLRIEDNCQSLNSPSFSFPLWSLFYTAASGEMHVEPLLSCLLLFLPLSLSPLSVYFVKSMLHLGHLPVLSKLAHFIPRFEIC